MSPIMKAAENAAKVVAAWSKSKREYAERVMASAPPPSERGGAT